MQNRTRLTVALALAFSLHCGSSQLVPAQPDPAGGAWAALPGLELRADAEAARRVWSVPSAFLALHITLRNTGAAPVFVAFSDIELRAGAQALPAVSPDTIPPRRRVASLGMDPASPFIARQNVGPGGARYGRSESVLLEPSYGSRVEATFGRPGPGAHEIQASAFRPGVIASGQTREGFVYFRAVPQGAAELRLRVGVRRDALASEATTLELVYGVRG